MKGFNKLMVRGTLFGIGVGCGDPRDMTLKAIDIIKSCDIIAVPRASASSDLVAYNIAKQSVDLQNKEILTLDMPMTRDLGLLNSSHLKACETIIERLESGENIAFLTLGDPTVYSTYIYIHKLVVKHGYTAQIIPGITSFTAVAARLGISLAEREEAIVIAPASYEGLEKALNLKGTKVLMKAGKSMEKVKSILKEKNMYDNAMMVERCFMENEVVHKNLDSANENSSYFSVIIIKEDK